MSPRSGQCTCRTWGSGSLAPFFPGLLPSLSSHHGCPGPCPLSAGSQAGRMAGFPWETRPAFKMAAGSTGSAPSAMTFLPALTLDRSLLPGQAGHRPVLGKGTALDNPHRRGRTRAEKGPVPESLLRPWSGHYCQLGNLSQLPTQVPRRKQNAGVPGGVPQVSDPHTALGVFSTPVWSGVGGGLAQGTSGLRSGRAPAAWGVLPPPGEPSGDSQGLVVWGKMRGAPSHWLSPVPHTRRYISPRSLHGRFSAACYNPPPPG